MVVKNDLQKYLDTKKTETRLIGPIERHLMKRTPDDRSTTVLHPSEMIKADFCYRYSAYLLMGGKKKQDNPNLRLQNIFDEGHFIHAKWQNRIYDMGNLWGDFKCQSCAGITSGLSPEICQHCKCATLVYDEVLKKPKHAYTKALLQCVPDAKGIKKLKPIQHRTFI